MAERLRVALVSDGLYPFFAGGKEVRLWELARRVAPSEVALEVHTMRWWAEGESVAEWQGIPLRAVCRPWEMYAGPRRSIWQAMMFALGSFRLVATRADVVDADHMPYLHLLPLWLVSRVKRVPLVVTWHEWWGRDYWSEYLGSIGRVSAAIEKLSARCADHIVVDSPETFDRLRRQGISEERMSLVPLGADLESIAAVPPADSRWDVLYAGRLLSHKRVDVLLDALALLRGDGRDLNCMVVGSGPEEDRLKERAARLGLCGVSFARALPEQASVWALMKSSRVFAYPSIREGFGLALLEAQAAGATVVTTDHPDNHGRLLVDHGSTGYLCGNGPGDLAAAIALALDKPARPDDLEAHVRRHCWGPRAEQLAAVYRDVASPKRRRGAGS
jgi:glycosyltransferase involved in cell wall biosynthesis